MALTVKMEGADDLFDALLQLPKRVTQKAVVRRALTKAAEPVRGLAAALAPYSTTYSGPYHLRHDIIVGTKTIASAGNPAAHPGDVTVYVGPDRRLWRHLGIFVELGTFKDRPQPFMRPAWAATKETTLKQIGYFMWVEIDGTAQRLARRA